MEGGKFVKVTTVTNEMEGQQIVEVLQAQKIAACYKHGSMDAYMGSSPEGGVILVPQEDAEAARQILKEFTPIQTASGSNGSKNSMKRRALGWILLAVILVICVVIPLLL